MVDQIDQQILKLLEDNARMTYVEIGSIVGLSEGAVRNRINSLLETGIIKKFTIEQASEVGVRALTMISVNPSTPTFEVSKSIGKLEPVERIYEVTGEYDVFIVLTSPNMEGVNQCIEDIRKIDGVVKTNTIIVLRTI